MKTLSNKYIKQYLTMKGEAINYDTRKLAQAINITVEEINRTVGKARVLFDDLNDEEGVLVNDFHGIYAEYEVKAEEVFAFLMGDRTFIKGLPHLSSYLHNTQDAMSLKEAFLDTYSSL